MSQDLCSAENLVKSYKGRTVVKGVSIKIKPGQIVGLLGPNGAGKSTMMKIIAGIENPTRGQVQKPKEAVIAYLPQHLLTEDNCTVFEEASKAFSRVFEMRDEMERLNKELETR